MGDREDKGEPGPAGSGDAGGGAVGTDGGGAPETGGCGMILSFAGGDGRPAGCRCGREIGHVGEIAPEEQGFLL